MSQLRPALSLLLLLGLMTGGLYPLAVTGLAQLLFPVQAHGSLVRAADGRVQGSTLLAQGFSQARYFHPRPSAAGDAGYDATASSGSNRGATSKALIQAVTQRAEQVRADRPGQAVPLELVTASASGLDPHLSPHAARWQAARVAQARGLDEAQVLDLIAAQTEHRQWGVLGPPRVNVLRLNQALDALPAPVP